MEVLLGVEQTGVSTVDPIEDSGLGWTESDFDEYEFPRAVRERQQPAWRTGGLTATAGATLALSLDQISQAFFGAADAEPEPFSPEQEPGETPCADRTCQLCYPTNRQ